MMVVLRANTHELSERDLIAWSDQRRAVKLILEREHESEVEFFLVPILDQVELAFCDLL